MIWRNFAVWQGPLFSQGNITDKGKVLLFKLCSTCSIQSNFRSILIHCLINNLGATRCIPGQGPRSKFSMGGAKEECVKEILGGGGAGGMLVDFFSISLRWQRMLL